VPDIQCSIPWKRRNSNSPPRPDWIWCPFSPLPNEYRGLPPRVKPPKHDEAGYLPPSGSKLKIRGPLPPLPIRFMVRCLDLPAKQRENPADHLKFSVGLLLTQDWKDVLFGVHWISRGVIHAATLPVASAGRFVDNHGLKELWTLCHSYQKGITGNSGIKGHCCDVDTRPFWANNDLGLRCKNCDNGFGSHCSNSTFQQWPRSPLLCDNVSQQWPLFPWLRFQHRPRFPLLQQYVPKMTPDHAGCLVRRGTWHR
jgi:hypothetical protein